MNQFTFPVALPANPAASATGRRLRSIAGGVQPHLRPGRVPFATCTARIRSSLACRRSRRRDGVERALPAPGAGASHVFDRARSDFSALSLLDQVALFFASRARSRHPVLRAVHGRRVPGTRAPHIQMTWDRRQAVWPAGLGGSALLRKSWFARPERGSHASPATGMRQPMPGLVCSGFMHDLVARCRRPPNSTGRTPAGTARLGRRRHQAPPDGGWHGLAANPPGMLRKNHSIGQGLHTNNTDFLLVIRGRFGPGGRIARKPTSASTANGN